MSTADQSASHVSLPIPSEQPPASDNFQFMSDTFTLPQDGQSGPAQATPGQGYAGTCTSLIFECSLVRALGKSEFDSQIRHRGWLGGTLDKQGYGWLLDTTNDDEDPNAEENRPLL